MKSFHCGILNGAELMVSVERLALCAATTWVYYRVLDAKCSWFLPTTSDPDAPLLYAFLAPIWNSGKFPGRHANCLYINSGGRFRLGLSVRALDELRAVFYPIPISPAWVDSKACIFGAAKCKLAAWLALLTVLCSLTGTVIDRQRLEVVAISVISVKEPVNKTRML